MEKCQNCTSFGANVSKQHRGLSKAMGNGDGEMQVVYNQGQDLLIALPTFFVPWQGNLLEQEFAKKVMLNLVRLSFQIYFLISSPTAIL